MSEPETPGFRFPTAFTILFALIALVAALTWIGLPPEKWSSLRYGF